MRRKVATEERSATFQRARNPPKHLWRAPLAQGKVLDAFAAGEALARERGSFGRKSDGALALNTCTIAADSVRERVEETARVAASARRLRCTDDSGLGALRSDQAKFVPTRAARKKKFLFVAPLH